MNLRLVTGPSRPAILDELLRRLPIGAGRVCAVVPDTGSAHRLERLLAAQNGGAALGARVYTFDRLARDIIAIDRVPPTLIPSHLRQALIHELIGSRIGGESRWQPIASCPGFAALVSSCIEDVRAGITSDGSDPDLTALVRAYDSHLARLGMTDHEGFVRLALADDTPERFAAAFDGPFIIEGFYDLTPHQFELAARLAAAFRRGAVCIASDPARPELFSLAAALMDRFISLGAVVTRVPSVPGQPVARVLASFMDGGEPFAVEGLERGAIEIHTFRSDIAEADWIAGTIRGLIATGICRPADIMVVTRATPDDNAPLHTMLRRHGVPVERGITRPLDVHPLAMCVLAALDASINPAEEALAAVLRSSYTLPDRLSSGTPLPATDTRGWSSMIADTDTPPGFAESMARMIDALGIGETIGSGGSDDSTTGDRGALDLILRSLDEFATFYRPLRPMMSVREFSRLFRRFIAGVRMHADPDTGGGVLLAGVMHARYADRPTVFMTGLDNASYPAAHDRFVLHPPAAAALLATRREREEPLLFLSAMSGARRLYLSYPGVDDEGGDAGMSPYLSELIVRIGESSTVVRHTGIPGAAWEGGASTLRGRHEQIVRALTAAADAPGLMRMLAGAAPSPARMVANAFARFAARTGGDGLRLISPGACHRIRIDWSGERPLPVTAIEQYRGCPAGFFFRYVLGVEPEEVPSESLDARERGSIIHDALARFFPALVDATGSARLDSRNLAGATAIMERSVDEAFRRWHRTLVRLNPLILATERQQLKRWMTGVVRIEADMQASSPFTPSAFEVSFGMDGAAPLVIEDEGETVALRGRIDRIDIDHTPDNTARIRVIDYKTGKKTTRREVETGAAIQLSLYLKAAAEVLFPDGVVSEGIYLNLREAVYDETKGRLAGCVTLDGDIGTVTDTAAAFAVEAVRGIRSGLFPAPAMCNRVCGWQPFCRGGMTSGEGGVDADR